MRKPDNDPEEIKKILMILSIFLIRIVLIFYILFKRLKGLALSHKISRYLSKRYLPILPFFQTILEISMTL